MNYLLLVYISSGLITASDSERKREWPGACTSGVSGTPSSIGLNTEPNIGDLVLKFGRWPEKQALVESWLRWFSIKKPTFNNCELRWCQLASAVFDDNTRHPEDDTSNKVFEIVRWGLDHYNLCEDGPYVYAHKVALDHNIIDPFVVELKVSSEHGFSTCEQSLRSFTKLRHEYKSLGGRDQNFIDLTNVVGSLAPGTKACLEPFCVVGFRIANKLLTVGEDQGSGEALEGVLEFIKVHSRDACNPTHYSLIDTWKSLAGLGN
jgi:hypothetical protein